MITSNSQCVFLVDDDPDMHKAVQSLLTSVGLPMEGYYNAQELLDSLKPDRDGCLVLDVRLPGMSGLDLYQQLREKGIDLPVLFLSGYADVSMAVRSIKMGALNLIEKPFNDQVLLDEIHQGLEEDRRRKHRKKESAEVAERMEALTRREKQVLEMVLTGRPNKQIAEELEISPKTLDIHRTNIRQKMKAQSIADLVRMVLMQKQGDFSD